jgi:hypothetical protein
MIKQIVIIVLVLTLITFYFYERESFKFIPDTVKYLIKVNYKTKIKKLNEIENNDIFSVDYNWTTNLGNYIYDNILDRYYIIEKGYYYSIPDFKRYTLTIVKNVNVNFFKIK